MIYDTCGLAFWQDDQVILWILHECGKTYYPERKQSTTCVAIRERFREGSKLVHPDWTSFSNNICYFLFLWHYLSSLTKTYRPSKGDLFYPETLLLLLRPHLLVFHFQSIKSCWNEAYFLDFVYRIQIEHIVRRFFRRAPSAAVIAFSSHP